MYNPEYNHTGRYDLKQNKFYKLGIKDHLEIYLDYEYSETAPKYSFQFMSGSVPTNIHIHGVSDHGSGCWSDPMNEIYCIYNVNVLGNVVSVKKAYYNHYLTLEAIEDTTFTFLQHPNGSGTIQYSLDGGNHRIMIIYRKDSSTNSNDDRGYVLIPKNQQ